jgi:hypothetical protein
MQTEEIRQALVLVDQTSQKVRRALLRDSFAPFAILWGTIWVVGFSTSALFPAVAGILWIALDIVGLVASVVLGKQYSRRVLSPNGLRLFWSWIALVGYLGLVLFLARPLPPLRADMLLVIIIMAGYVIQGIWLWRGQLIIGLVITAVTLLGGWFLPDYYLWLMALLGGGTLLGTGLYLWIVYRP